MCSDPDKRDQNSGNTKMNKDDETENKTDKQCKKRDLRINWSKQGKYIPGHPKYLKGKSIILYPDSETSKFASTKQQLNNVDNISQEKLKSNKSELELRIRVLLSLQRALLGEIPPSLRGVTVGWDSSEIIIHCFFDGEISEDDHESMEVVATEVLASFHQTHKVFVKCFRKDAPENLNQYALEAWAYHRRE
jgi:hypothetical protein